MEKGLLTESTGTLHRSAASDLKVQVPLRMLCHTARTGIRLSKREGSGTFFVYGKSYGESTQNGKQEQVKAGYHRGGGILPFCFVFPYIALFGLIAAYIRTWSVRTYAGKRAGSDI